MIMQLLRKIFGKKTKPVSNSDAVSSGTQTVHKTELGVKSPKDLAEELKYTYNNLRFINYVTIVRSTSEEFRKSFDTDDFLSGGTNPILQKILDSIYQSAVPDGSGWTPDID